MRRNERGESAPTRACGRTAQRLAGIRSATDGSTRCARASSMCLRSPSGCGASTKSDTAAWTRTRRGRSWRSRSPTSTLRASAWWHACVCGQRGRRQQGTGYANERSGAAQKPLPAMWLHVVSNAWPTGQKIRVLFSVALTRMSAPMLPEGSLSLDVRTVCVVSITADTGLTVFSRLQCCTVSRALSVSVASAPS